MRFARRPSSLSLYAACIARFSPFAASSCDRSAVRLTTFASHPPRMDIYTTSTVCLYFSLVSHLSRTLYRCAISWFEPSYFLCSTRVLSSHTVYQLCVPCILLQHPLQFALATPTPVLSRWFLSADCYVRSQSVSFSGYTCFTKYRTVNISFSERSRMKARRFGCRHVRLPPLQGYRVVSASGSSRIRCRVWFLPDFLLSVACVQTPGSFRGSIRGTFG